MRKIDAKDRRYQKSKRIREGKRKFKKKHLEVNNVN